MRYVSAASPLLFCVMLGMLIGLGAFTFRYAEGLSYLSDDPAACVNCHVMQEQYDSWTRSSHRIAASCNDCHVPHDLAGKYLAKGKNGWNHSKAFTLQDFKEPIRIHDKNRALLQHNCIECHEVAVSEIAGHADVELGETRCTDCHRSVGHMGAF